MAGILYLGKLFGKALDRVSWHEPCRLDTVLVPELEESVDADGGSEDATRDVGWVCWRSIASVDPTNNNVKTTVILRGLV